MSFQHFEYSLNTLRENIILELQGHGADMEMGAVSATPIELIITKNDLVTEADKLLMADKAKISTVGTNGFTVATSIPTLVGKVENLINDGVPRASSTEINSTQLSLVRQTIMEKVEKLIFDNTAKLGGTGGTGSFSLPNQDLLDAIELLIQDNTPTLDASASVKTISLTTSVIEGKIYERSAYKGSRLKNDQGTLIDEVALTEDELNIVQTYYLEAAKNVQKVFEPFLNTYAESTSIVYTFKSSKEFTALYIDALSRQVETYLVEYSIYRWLQNIGLNAEAEAHLKVCAGILESLTILASKKDATLTKLISLACKEADTALTILKGSTGYNYSSPNHTFEAIVSDISTGEENEIKYIIEKFVIKKAASDWCRKIGINQAEAYEKDAEQLLGQLQRFKMEKKETLQNAIETAVSNTQDILSVFSSYAFSTDTYTFTLSTGYNLSSKAITALTGMIEQYTITHSAEVWAAKQGFDIAAKFKADATEYQNKLKGYTLQKYDAINTIFNDVAAMVLNILEPIQATLSAQTIVLSDVHLTTASVDALKKLVEYFILYKTAELWALKVGNPLSEKYATDAMQVLDEMSYYVQEKYDTFNASFDLAVVNVEQLFSYITNTPATKGTAQYIFNLINNGNFSTGAQQILPELISQYFIFKGISDWYIKTANKATGIYKEKADEAFMRLSSLVERKRDKIDKFIKRSAFRLYDRFNYVSKSQPISGYDPVVLDRPVLYDESHTYNDEIVHDGEDEITITGSTIDATGKIYYRMILNKWWNESVLTALDNDIEEALTQYVVKEYFKFKKQADDYAIANENYEYVVTEVKKKLALRKAGKPTRRSTGFL